ncbi:MAG: DUF2142 domain-containing protein [Myxococcota bacterium]
MLATCFGLAFTIATPPLDPADEVHHLARIFALSEGHISPAGPSQGHRHEIPRSLNQLHPPYWFKHRDGRIDRTRRPGAQIVCIHDVDDVLASLRMPLLTEERVAIRRPSTYGPLPYLPQALAVRIGRQLGGTAGALLYAARLSTLAVWIALVWLALRITPAKPWTLMVLSLSPMSLFQSSVISADAVTNALALLLLALALNAALSDRTRVPRSVVAGLVAVTAALGWLKQGYWLLGALLLLIPMARFRNRTQWGAAIGVAVVAMAALSWSWVRWLRVAQGVDGATTGLGDMLASFSEMGPWLSTLSGFAYRLLAQLVGILGHLDVVLPRWIYSVYPVAAIAVALIERDPPGLSIVRRLALVSIALGAAFSVLALLYSISPDPRTATPGMIQGRYFIPMLPVLFVAIPGFGRLPRVWGPAAVTGFCAFVLAVATYTTASHYFVGTPPAN